VTSAANLGRATEVLTEALALDQKQGGLLGVAMDRQAARTAGAGEAVRLLAGIPILEFDAALVERFLAPARAAIARHEWNCHFRARLAG
jgi:hypothetical protein